MNRKRILAIALTGTLLLSSFSGERIFADTNEITNRNNYFYQPMEPVVPYLSELLPEEEAILLEGEGDSDQEPLAGSFNDRVNDGDLPAAWPAASGSGELDNYLNSSLPNTRDQNPFGTCWVFASTALSEIGMRKADPNAVYDLSESHLVHYSYNNVSNPLTKGTSHAQAGDYVYTNMSESAKMDYGGCFEVAAEILAQWKGHASENYAPYPSDAYTANATDWSQKSPYLDNKARLTDWYKINLKQNPELAKYWIKEHGAVGITYYHDSNYYDSRLNAYYYTGSYTSGHAVSVVGWDDNFSFASFGRSSKPQKPGAWLIRNSWSDEGGLYSEYRYFWISYEDKGLGQEAFAFETEPVTAQSAENNYTYTDNAHWLSAQYQKTANLFQAVASENGEKLTEVSVAVFRNANKTTSDELTVKVYVGGNGTNPVSGTLSATKTRTIPCSGRYTVKLDTPVTIRHGQYFSVVAEMRDGYVCTESNTYIGSSISLCTGSNANESCFYSYNTWYKGSGGNNCIDAHTVNLSADEKPADPDPVTPDPVDPEPVEPDPVNPGPVEPITPDNPEIIDIVDVESITLDKHDVKVKPGEKITLTATVQPANAQNYGFSWSSSGNCSFSMNCYYNMVTLATFNPGTITITVRTGNGTFSDQCKIRVQTQSTEENEDEESGKGEEGEPGKGEEGEEGEPGKGEEETVSSETLENTVKAYVKINGKKRSFKVTTKYDSACAYTGKKISPQKQLSASFDLSSIAAFLPELKAGYEISDLLKVSFVSKNNLKASMTKPYFYAKLTLAKNKLLKKAGLKTKEINNLKKIITAVNKKCKAKPCHYAIIRLTNEKKISKV